MKKKLFKWVIVPAMAIVSAFSLSSFASSSEGSGYCWGTLSVVAGIAVCDGAADNCTKPC